MFSITRLSLEELAELERRHRSPAARQLLTEIWRLRLIEVEAEQLARMLANEHVEWGGIVGALVIGLRERLGLPTQNEELRKAPKRDDNGVWQAYRVETAAHRSNANQIGRSLTPLEWGEISDRLQR